MPAGSGFFDLKLTFLSKAKPSLVNQIYTEFTIKVGRARLREAMFQLARYLGVVFSGLFVFFLGLSFWFLLQGSESQVTQMLVYGFYSLIIGACFQIANYLGRETSSKLELGTRPAAASGAYGRNSRQTRKILGVVFVGALLTSGLTFAYQQNMTQSTTASTQTSTTSSLSQISARLFFTKVFPEPLNQTLVSFGVLGSGSIPPYSYTAMWSDNFSQSNNVGTFSRTFTQGYQIPSTATVTVTSSENTSTTIIVDLSQAESSTRTASLPGNASLSFDQSGLPSGTLWTVQLNGAQESGKGSTITFPSVKSGNYNFSVSFLFNGNYSSVFDATPKNGSIVMSGTNRIQNITFHPLALDQLVTPQSVPSVSSSIGSILIKLSYFDNLPSPVALTLVAVVNDSSGKLATVSTGRINLNTDSISQGLVYVTSLSPGRYSAVLYILASNGDVLSPKSSVTFSVPFG
jgi:hypothetical protein